MSTKKISDADAAATLDGTELVPGSQSGGDVKITTQAIADLGDGLPSQWTDGGNGDVTATVDDITKTPLTIQAQVEQDTPLVEILDETGSTLFHVDQEAGAVGATLSFALSNAVQSSFQLDNAPSSFRTAFWQLVISGIFGFTFDSFQDVADESNSYTTLTITGPTAGQATPLLLCKFLNTVVFAVSPTGALDMPEQTDPAAPAANTARLYCRDTGGKSQLVCRFPSGAVQVIATEP